MAMETPPITPIWSEILSLMASTQFCNVNDDTIICIQTINIEEKLSV